MTVCLIIVCAVCLIIVCAMLVAVAAAAARALRSSPGRPGRRPGPLPPGPAGPGTGNDHWYSASCPTLHDIAPEMLVRPYTLREAPRGHDPGTMRPRQR